MATALRPNITFTVPNPYTTPWTRWAQLLKQDLAAYNVPNPPTDERLWATWAVKLLTIPQLVARGVPNPKDAADWRSWAAKLIK